MRRKRTCSCSYLVAIDASATDAELQGLAAYLSTLDAAGCEVVVLDPAPAALHEQRRRILRWVARYVPTADTDVLQAAVDVPSAEKVIVAQPDSRYTAAEVAAMCSLLDHHEAVEPEEFVQPMPWWGGIDAARMLLRRGLDHPYGGGRTFAMRKSAWRPLRGFEDRERENHVRRLIMQGADVQPAREVFVRREPPQFAAWARRRVQEAAADVAVPFHAIFFAGILPLLVMLGLIGGLELAGGYAGVIGFASILIAVRGRWGAGRFFPLRACLFAPLSIAERAVSVYWAWIERLRSSRIRRDATTAPREQTRAVK